MLTTARDLSPGLASPLADITPLSSDKKTRVHQLTDRPGTQWAVTP
jgi:hypothetical protein